MKSVHINLPEEHYNLLKTEAEKLFMPLTVYIRGVLLGAVDRKGVKKELSATETKVDKRLSENRPKRKKPVKQYKLGDPVFMNTQFGKIELRYALNKLTGVRGPVEIYKTLEQPEIYSTSEEDT